MRLVPGIYVTCVLQVSASGLRAEWLQHPQKKVRRHQWTSEHAAVVGIEVEVLHAAGLQEEAVLDVDTCVGSVRPQASLESQIGGGTALIPNLSP